MRVTIVDVEWYDRKSFLPNPKCMKLSSYYKQQNAIINFPTHSFELKFDYDLLFVIKDNENSSLPQGINLLDTKVNLIGKGLQFYSRYKEDIDDVVAACRPDYNLYPIREENRMSKCNIVQFFHQGKPLPLIQDFKNTYKRTKNTYVIDEGFWSYSAETLKPMVEILRREKNIIFAGAIDFKSILADEQKTQMFSELKIDYVRNNFNCDLTTIDELNRFTKIMKNTSKTTRSHIKITIPIHYQANHFKYPNQPLQDLISYFKFINDMKKLQVNIILLAPSRAESPFWFYFEDFEAWTKTNFHLSYIEFMTLPLRLFTKQYDLFKFLDDKQNLANDAIDRMRTLWVWYPDIINQFAYTCWGERKIEGLNMKKIFQTSVIGGKK